MKFKLFLKEDSSRKEIEDWFRQWTKGGLREFNDWLENGKLAPRWAVCDVWAHEASQKFDPPMPSSWWPALKDFSITIEWSNKVASIIVPNFQKMPDANTILLSHATVESFKGIEKLSRLETLEFGEGHCSFDGGVLSLLKPPELTKVRVGQDVMMHPSKVAALKIVDRHLGEKDISECMDELIEAGLKEYAKL